MKDFKKYYVIPATPEEVYLALTNAVSWHLMTGENAVMSNVEGSEFSLWNGSITGKNISFEENRKIVQQWYFEGESPDSIVTMKLHQLKNQTSLELSHLNIPDSDFENIIDGWTNIYMSALIEFFEE